MNVLNESNHSSEFGTDLIQIIEEELDLRQWGFHLSYTKLGKISGSVFRRLIYNSEWCRMQFEYYRGGPPQGHELYMYYGRLHAQNDGSTMIWNGEKCYCWHGSGLTHLYFLDRVPPAEVGNWQRASRLPRAVEDFNESDLSKRLRREGGPRFAIARESAIWKHYGLRLFELFDLRRPDLWEQYVGYLKEFYRVQDEELTRKGMKPTSFNPPQYKRC